MAEYLVGVEQTRPYEWVTLEIFREEADAFDYASRFADGHGYIQVSKRRWRYCEDDKQHLIVLKRSSWKCHATLDLNKVRQFSSAQPKYGVLSISSRKA